MSGNDPFDPFGQNERTIIRPNPGGRAPQQPQNPGQGQPSQGQPSQGQPPQGQPGYPPQQPQQPNPYQPTPPRPQHQQGGDFMQPMQDPYAQRGGQPQWGPQGQQPAGAPVQPTAPVALIPNPGNNPLLTAAGPLLDLLGRLRNAMTQASFTSLKQSVSREIENFEAAASAAGAYQQHLRDAKYALCAVADDIVQNLPGEDRHVWTQDPMLGRYFGERVGGTQFYAKLAEAMKNPGANYDLLELYYVCLSLGFEGMHRASQTGQAAVQAARRDVYQALRGVNPGGGWELSPHWKGMQVDRRSIGMQIPFWAVAALVALLLAGTFFGLRYLLGEKAYATTSEIRNIHPTGAIKLDNPVREGRAVANDPPPPPPPTVDDKGQLERIQAALADEIAAGLVEARYLDANFIIVRFSNKLLFPSGGSDVTDDFKEQLAKRLGEVFANETQLMQEKGLRHGRVVAIGHSDAERISAGSRWKSNYELSEARAKNVMDAIQRWSPPDLRTLIEGRGPDDPICTPAEDRSCWAENRRVELLIERTK